MAYIGEIAALFTSLCWAFAAIGFTKSTQQVGAQITNRVRVFLAMLVLILINALLYGQPIRIQIPAIAVDVPVVQGDDQILLEGAPQALHTFSSGRMVCPQYAQGWALSEAPQIGHQANSGAIPVPQLGQGGRAEPTLVLGKGPGCGMDKAANGIRVRTKLPPHMASLLLQLISTIRASLPIGQGLFATIGAFPIRHRRDLGRGLVQAVDQSNHPEHYQSQESNRDQPHHRHSKESHWILVSVLAHHSTWTYHAAIATCAKTPHHKHPG